MVSADYVVGLTDGEGCFYTNVRTPYNKFGGARVELCFFIKVREQDRELLEKVRNTLGCGAVYFQHETRPHHTQCYRYTVNSHRDIIGTIIPFFEAHPLQGASKQKSFAAFCEIAKIVQQGEHLISEGAERILAFKKQMNHRTR